MPISNEQLAELLAGITRAQQAIIDAVERADAGFKSAHLVPMLNVAANMRQANARLIDLPSRILLRSQGRVAMDIGTIVRDLELALSGEVSAAPPGFIPPTAYAPGAKPSAAPAAPAAAGGDDMNFTAKP
jgi:hypothetical protein